MGPLTGGEPLLYVYAVVRSAAVDGPPADPPPDVTLGGGLTTVEHRGLTALVEPVPAADFGEAPLRERLEDPDWLARMARAHHGVLAAAGRRTTAVPLRLGTVRRGEPGVRRLLEEGEDGFSKALGRPAGAHRPRPDRTPGELHGKGFAPARSGYTDNMSASEKNSEKPASTGNAGKAENGSEGAGGPASGALSALPAPLAEKTLAAVHAVRGAGGLAWNAVRTRKALTGGTAAFGAAALTGAYALGRRTGTRSRGPLTRLTGGRI
ncbi:GvpL/GvpF family gas vesicle protein [Streptomyces bikiniensis]|uniref:GvpL/GvpF family gas vesicle protein n=1 Tax=Streptomyces bikiniensis TaxID=1896 RepID=A0ABW8CXZ7_STRBI